jgi:hypothetical protein
MVDGKLFIKQNILSQCAYLVRIYWAPSFSSWFLILHLVDMDNQFASIVPNMHLSHLIKKIIDMYLSHLIIFSPFLTSP